MYWQLGGWERYLSILVSRLSSLPPGTAAFSALYSLPYSQDCRNRTSADFTTQDIGFLKLEWAIDHTLVEFMLGVVQNANA